MTSAVIATTIEAEGLRWKILFMKNSLAVGGECLSQLGLTTASA
jgi:hypothetical protein